jgi:hypothetical protein
MTPETHVPVAASDGFVTYDELRGPHLSAARWKRPVVSVAPMRGRRVSRHRTRDRPSSDRTRLWPRCARWVVERTFAWLH